MKTLKEMLAELPKDASIADVFKIISEWERLSLIEFRKREKTTKSGRLGQIVVMR